MRARTAFLIVMLLPAWAGSRPDFPTDYFRSPLGIPLSLSGNFAEMRSNHFHAGLDIRTNAQTGYRVYAAADGWIARMAVSPGGYGNALYLQHPNGYTTVYGHLDRFEEPLASWVKERQYQNRSFATNLFPDQNQFRFAKGDVIGYSGNSGSSGGPHLHFEIRDSGTSEPLNPLLFGLPVTDSTPPRIYRLKVYVNEPSGSAAFVSAAGDTLSRAGFGSPASWPVSLDAAGRYALERGAHVAARGSVGFGIQAHDYHDDSRSRLGLYTTTLRAGEQEIFNAQMERLNFSTQRFVNAHLDYAERIQNQRWLQRSHILPGNSLPYYRSVRNGYLFVRSTDRYPMSYSLADAYGNTTELDFEVRGAALATPPPRKRQGYFVSYDQPETFVVPGLIVRIPRGALYEDAELAHSTAPPHPGTFSVQHRIHDAATAIHQPITVSVQADELPARLQDKALLARISGNRLVSHGGSFNNGYVTASVRNFGTYTIAADTVRPEIRPINVPDGAALGSASSIRLTIRDDLSGIATYDARVDGEWVLFEYDAKRSLIYHTFDGRIRPGRHELNVTVVDGKGNTARYRAGFTR